MSIPLRLLLVHSLTWSAAPLGAQCSTVWSSGSPQPELTGQGTCSTTWDPDGAGPMPSRLVIGGARLSGGDEPADRRVMTWDGSEWQSLGPGPGADPDGGVGAFVVWNGMLVAGGTFAGGGVDHVALWNGSSWQALGAGFPTPVAALAVWNGELVAVGSTGVTAGVPVIQRWNGVAWNVLPAPPLLERPHAVTSFQGLLCVAGYRASSPSGGVLERWNGTSWQPSITANGEISCLSVRVFSLTSALYVGGSFTSIGGVAAPRIASTSGGSAFAWQPVGGGVASNCSHLHVRATSALGTAVVACLEGLSSPVVQLNGGLFVSMGLTRLRTVSYYGGSYHGATDMEFPIACHRFDGSSWAPVRGPGILGDVLALTRSGDDMIIGGSFTSVSGVALHNIARWNGTTFQPLGSGIDGTGVDVLLTLANGDVVAGGRFHTAGGSSVDNIARWNGSTWSPLGTGLDDRVCALCEMPNGDIVAGGWFDFAGSVFCQRIARWDGSAWSPMGTGMSADVMALAVRGDGTLFAGGGFSTAGGAACSRIAQWNGSMWLPVGTGCNGAVHGLAVRPNDDVVAVGAFTSAGGTPVDRCASWDGTAWNSTGASSGDPGPACAVLALPNGDVVVGRGFHRPAASHDAGIARWNGSTWSGFGSGLAVASPGSSVAVRALAQRADGDVVVGGGFSVAGGLTAQGLARSSTTCPATAQPYGAGCNSAAGPLVLTAEALPWIGATVRTATTGIAPLSLCLGVTGFMQLSVPLSSLLVEGQPGCSLLASPDLTTLLLQFAPDTARSELPLPSAPSLVGVSFYQQTVALEFTGLFVLAAVRSSNALVMTIGAL